MNQCLIIIDIQNDYFEGGANCLVDSFSASQNAAKILKHFRDNSLPVIHIQHLAVRTDATFFVPNSFGAEIHENVKPIAGEKIIVKNFPNSFRCTDLLEYLQANDISDLVFCGMMTQMCVDATVRAAKDYGYNCTVIADACATKDLEILGEKVVAKEVQNSFLAGLNYFYSNVITSQQFLEN